MSVRAVGWDLSNCQDQETKGGEREDRREIDGAVYPHGFRPSKRCSPDGKVVYVSVSPLIARSKEETLCWVHCKEPYRRWEEESGEEGGRRPYLDAVVQRGGEESGVGEAADARVYSCDWEGVVWEGAVWLGRR